MKIREMLLTNKNILLQLEEMRKSLAEQEDRVDLVNNYLVQFMDQQKNQEPKLVLNQMNQNK